MNQSGIGVVAGGTPQDVGVEKIIGDSGRELRPLQALGLKPSQKIFKDVLGKIAEIVSMAQGGEMIGVGPDKFLVHAYDLRTSEASRGIKKIVAAGGH